MSDAGDCVRRVGSDTLCGSCTNLHDTLLKLVNTLKVGGVTCPRNHFHTTTTNA